MPMMPAAAMDAIPFAGMIFPVVPLVARILDDEDPVAVDGEVKPQFPFEIHPVRTDALRAKGGFEGSHRRWLGMGDPAYVNEYPFAACMVSTQHLHQGIDLWLFKSF